jgi:hypothetical protein
LECDILDFIWVLIGVAIIIFALYALFSPPKKHKDFTFSDQRKATGRALGGNAPPDASDVIPQEYKKKKQ